ncbi:MAG: hypothetical protein ACK4RV_06700 [Caulobacter sp.]
MQLLHLGLWKTATTGFQELIFKPDTRRPYYGVKGEQTDAWRHGWIRRLVDGQLGGDWAAGDYVFSDESALVRMGGRANLGAVGRSIARSFKSPKVLLTVREPASLLVSAYFQSVAVRGRAVGDGDHGPSYRFVKFPDWWRVLKARHETSLAGLLDYVSVRDQLARAIGPENVSISPLEEMTSNAEGFRDTMLGLGCDAGLVSRFLAHPRVNSTTGRRLRRSCGPLMAFGRGLDVLDHPAIERLAYFGREIDLAARYPDVIAEIREAYPYDPAALTAPPIDPARSRVASRTSV